MASPSLTALAAQAIATDLVLHSWQRAQQQQQQQQLPAQASASFNDCSGGAGGSEIGGMRWEEPGRGTWASTAELAASVSCLPDDLRHGLLLPRVAAWGCLDAWLLRLLGGDMQQAAGAAAEAAEADADVCCAPPPCASPPGASPLGASPPGASMPCAPPPGASPPCAPPPGAPSQGGGAGGDHAAAGAEGGTPPGAAEGTPAGAEEAMLWEGDGGGSGAGASGLLPPPAGTGPAYCPLLLPGGVAVQWLLAGSSGGGGNGPLRSVNLSCVLAIQDEDVADLCSSSFCCSSSPSSPSPSASPARCEGEGTSGQGGAANTMSSGQAIATTTATATVGSSIPPPVSPCPPLLRHLSRLDLSGCPLVGDGALAALAEGVGMTPTLTSLSLAGCSQARSLGLLASSSSSSCGLPCCAALRELDVSGCWQVEGGQLQQVLQVTSCLTSLSLRDCHKVGSAALWDMAAAPVVRRLDVQRTGVGDDLAMRAAHRWRDLRDLRVTGCAITSYGVALVLLSKSLMLGSVLPDDVHPDVREVVARFQQEAMQLRDTIRGPCSKLEVLHAGGLIIPRGLVQMQTALDAYTNAWPDANGPNPPQFAELEALLQGAGVGCLDTLTSLDLSESLEVSDRVLDLIAGSCPGLTALRLSRCTLLTDDGAADVGRLRALQLLDVSGCTGGRTVFVSQSRRFARGARTGARRRYSGIGNAGLLAAFRGTSVSGDVSAPTVKTAAMPLRSLSLAELRVTDALLCDSDFLAAASGLTSLDLSRCTAVTDHGVMQVMLRCPGLVALRLGGTACTDAFLGCYHMWIGGADAAAGSGSEAHPCSQGQGQQHGQQQGQQHGRQQGRRLVSSLSHVRLGLVSLPPAACTPAAMAFLSSSTLRPLGSDAALRLPSPLTCMAGRSQLAKAKLNASSLSDADVAVLLEGCPLLRALSLLRAEALSDDALRCAAERCRLLTQFVCEDSLLVSDAGVRELLCGLPALQKLGLNGCTRVTDAAFVGAAADDSADIANAGAGTSCCPGREGSAVLAAAAAWGPAGPLGQQLQRRRRRWPIALRSVSLRGAAGFTDDGAAELGLRCRATLEHAGLRQTGITHRGAAELLGSCGGLAVLDCAARGVSEGGLKSLLYQAAVADGHRSDQQPVQQQAAGLAAAGGSGLFGRRRGLRSLMLPALPGVDPRNLAEGRARAAHFARLLGPSGADLEVTLVPV